MKTILVLTDHSYSSFNASRYALTFAGNFESSKVVFYNSYDSSTDSSNELASISAGLDSLNEINTERMADLLISLEPFRNHGTLVECFTDARHLVTAATEICRDFPVDFIIAGSKNRSAVGMILIGSRILDVLKKVDIPLLIIPPAYIYEPVMCAVLATDLMEIEKLPRTFINSIIRDYRCKLIILNVDSHKRERADIDQIGKIHQLMDTDQPEYHYTQNRDINKGIKEFCDAQHAGLLMIVHKEHGLLYNVFYKSVERSMILDSHVPLLVLKPGGQQVVL